MSLGAKGDDLRTSLVEQLEQEFGYQGDQSDSSRRRREFFRAVDLFLPRLQAAEKVVEAAEGVVGVYPTGTALQRLREALAVWKAQG